VREASLGVAKARSVYSRIYAKGSSLTLTERAMAPTKELATDYLDSQLT
jgi:hypothetical protein